jgi:hypothetical protein
MLPGERSRGRYSLEELSLMRLLTIAVVALLIGAGTLVHTQTPSTDPQTILAATREALGGDKKLAAVKSFVASGRTRQIKGENLVPIEFEISVELPGKYLRKDEIPSQDTGPTALGFSGDQLLQEPAPQVPTPPPNAKPGGPDPAAMLAAMQRGRLAEVKQDFVRLTLGMFATSFESFPLTFTYVGQAEAPQGKAHVLEAKGPDNFTARFFIDMTTRLPLMVSWQGSAGRGGRGMGMGRGGSPPAAGAPAAAPPAGAAPPAPGAGAPPTPPKPVEQRIYYADYRESDGLMLPFRIRRATGADTMEETVFDRFRLNARIDPRKFEVRK